MFLKRCGFAVQTDVGSRKSSVSCIHNTYEDEYESPRQQSAEEERVRHNGIRRDGTHKANHPASLDHHRSYRSTATDCNTHDDLIPRKSDKKTMGDST